jgi:outer membrane protein assembly factor BamB
MLAFLRAFIVTFHAWKGCYHLFPNVNQFSTSNFLKQISWKPTIFIMIWLCWSFLTLRVDKKDGVELWHFDVGGILKGWAAVADGVVYFGGFDGLYAAR